MNKTAETTQPLDLPPMRVSRTFHAPREIVFNAWSSADHVKRWFAPTGYTIPRRRSTARGGGAFEVLMRAPDRAQHWARGTIAEVSSFDRLVIDLPVKDAKGHALFRAFTELTSPTRSAERSSTSPRPIRSSTRTPRGWLRARRRAGRRRSTI